MGIFSLPFLIQTPSPDQMIGTALIFSEAMYAICSRVSGMLSAKGIDQHDFLLNLFVICLASASIHYVYEFSKTFRSLVLPEEGMTGLQQVVSTVLDPSMVKRTIRLAVFGLLGAATMASIRNDWNLKVPLLKATAVPKVQQMLGFSDGSSDLMMGHLGTIKGSIKGASQQLGAWHIARTVQDAAIKGAAEIAAGEVWQKKKNEAPENVANTSEDSNAEDSLVTKFISAVMEKISNIVARIGNSIMAYGTALVLLVANLGLDLLIVRTIWFNAFYLLIIYKVLLVFLPLMCILAYWPSLDSFLVNGVKQLVVVTITITVLSSATSFMFSNSKIESLALAATSYESMTISYKLEKYAEDIYNKMLAKADPRLSNIEAFKAECRAGIDRHTDNFFLGLETNFFAPIRVFLVLALMITLLGKMVTVVNDAISGTMTYHRG
jgi:hypothetical protein